METTGETGIQHPQSPGLAGTSALSGALRRTQTTASPPFSTGSEIRSAKGQTWTQLRVRNFRGGHQIPVYREGERAERHELILSEAASRLGVHKMTVVRLIQDGLLPARQVCAGAPYVIREDDLAQPAIRQAIAKGRPVSRDPRQESLPF